MQDQSYTNRTTAGIALVTDKLGFSVLLYAYAMLLGATYLFGYWRAFGFDIFPYASSIDYVSAPLNRMFVLVSTPLLFSLVLFGQSERANSKLFGRLTLYLILLYSVAFVSDFYQGTKIFLLSDFHYRNEQNALVISALLYFAGCGFAYRIVRGENGALICTSALILTQLACTLSAGYRDGKTIFHGADNVFFLENKILCESGGIRDWVYLGKFSDKTFFMNTIDKRLCITSSGSFNITSRKFSEGL